MVGLLKLVVEVGGGTVALEAVDRPRHDVALPVGCAAEADAALRLGAQAGDHRHDSAPVQGCPGGAAGVALVPGHAVRAQARTPTPRPADRPPLHQRRHLRRLVPLAGRQDEADRLAAPLGPDAVPNR